jgi:hypothetical protein
MNTITDDPYADAVRSLIDCPELVGITIDQLRALAEWQRRLDEKWPDRLDTWMKRVDAVDRT